MLELKKMCGVVSGNTDVSGFDWEYGEDLGAHIILYYQDAPEDYTMICYNKETEKPIFSYEHVRKCCVTERGIIIERTFNVDGKNIIKSAFHSFDGEITIPFDDYAICECHKNEDYLFVKKQGREGIYRYTGEQILPISYDAFKEYHGLVVCENNGKKGLYFFKTKKYYKPSYKEVKLLAFILYEDNLRDYFVIANNGDEYDIYDSSGELICSGKYEFLEECMDYFNPYLRIKLYGKNDTYLYIPDINTFVKGTYVRQRELGRPQYWDDKASKWRHVAKNMYGNAKRIKDLYQYEEETKWCLQYENKRRKYSNCMRKYASISRYNYLRNKKR